MIKSGFCKIIGIRDVFPNFERKDIYKLEMGLRYRLPQTPIETEFIISVMEIETCFLAEHNHFEKIDPALNVTLISKTLGFNPLSDDMQLRDSPSDDLDKCYALVQKNYTKDDIVVDRTINSLDYSHIYYNLKGNITHLGKLIHNLDEFFHN